MKPCALLLGRDSAHGWLSRSKLLSDTPVAVGRFKTFTGANDPSSTVTPRPSCLADCSHPVDGSCGDICLSGSATCLLKQPFPGYQLHVLCLTLEEVTLAFQLSPSRFLSHSLTQMGSREGHGGLPVSKDDHSSPACCHSLRASCWDRPRSTELPTHTNLPGVPFFQSHFRSF